MGLQRTRRVVMNTLATVSHLPKITSFVAGYQSTHQHPQMKCYQSAEWKIWASEWGQSNTRTSPFVCRHSLALSGLVASLRLCVYPHLPKITRKKPLADVTPPACNFYSSHRLTTPRTDAKTVASNCPGALRTNSVNRTGWMLCALT